jgi:putative heme-binding domain-containing protein
LEPIAKNLKAEPSDRTAALRAILTLRSDAGLPLVPDFLKDPAVPMNARLEIVPLVARYNSTSARTVLVNALREAPDRLGAGILSALCGSPEGVDVALAAVEKGYAPRNQLMDRSIRERIQSVHPQSLERLSKLMASIQPDSERLLRIAAERASEYIKVSGNPKLGEPIFQRTCAVCHSLGGKGGNIGPQLDGIGNRGLERLCEDVLNPSRNVDPVFRQTAIVLKDGDLVNGLVRREEGERLVLVDATGKEVGIPKSSVESRNELETSLMPDNFAEAISTDEFRHLMAFLLSQRTPLPR